MPVRSRIMRRILPTRALGPLVFGHLIVGVGASSFSLAGAQSATSSFAVTATVEESCSITTSDLAFGVYSTISGGALDGSSTIQVRCTLDAAYSVSLNAGATPGGSIPARLMADGPTTLGYNLYTTNARTSVWGDGTGGTSVVTRSYLLGLGGSRTEHHPAYGRLPAGQNVSAGAYADTVIATVVF